MGAALGLLAGIGLVLVWRGVSTARPAAAATPGRLRAALDGAGLSAISPRAFVLGSLGLALGVLVVVQAVSRTLPVAVAFAGLAGYLPTAYLAGRVRRRQRELADVWPDVVDNLASAVRAGLSLAEALAALGDRGPEPLRPQFRAFAADHQSSGRFDECLDRLKDRLADPVGDRVVEGLRVAREVGGGDLGRLLRSLSAHLRDDARTRAELEARQSWVVNGARLAVAAPWLVLLSMSVQPELIGRYGSAAGAVVLTVGGLACLLAYRLMVRIGRLPTERRLLG